MNVTDAITLAMSRQDGARAAAVLVADRRLTPDIPDIEGGSDPSHEWGDRAFCLEDAMQSAFLGDGCESYSRHQQMTGFEWHETHFDAFGQGFFAVARLCLWPGGIHG